LPQGTLSCGNEPSGSFRSILAVAGIANPERFFTALKQADYTVVDTLTFRDHHQYSAADIATIQRASRVGASAVFTTDKDAVRFEALGRTPFDLYRVPLRVEFDPAEALFESVRAVLK
jgi:tetraacyldisaccharide 4'-kinase